MKNGKLENYYNLTKPGIIKGNAISFIAGFLLASRVGFSLRLFISALVGTSLVIASACVLNNIYDSKIDARMQRTKNREIPLGLVSAYGAFVFACILLISGQYLLVSYVNHLTAYLGLLAVFLYTVVYTVSKRYTYFSTELGSLSGAMPILAGYVSVAGKIDWVAISLFLIMVFWQMPHFYAIAIKRMDDYKNAKIPTLPIVKGLDHTKSKSIIFLWLYFASLLALIPLADLGFWYVIFSLPYALYWLNRASRSKDIDSFWQKTMFKMSLKALLLFCLGISLDSLF